MIELSGAQLRLLRENISRCLTPLPRSRTTPISIESGPTGVIVRAKGDHAAIEWRLAGSFSSERLVVALSALKDCSRSRSAIVTLENAGSESVLARWTERRIPQSIECFGGEFPSDFPAMPDQVADNEPHLISALRDAAEVVENENHRYALECLQLRPTDGAIGATDGKQALVQTGFRFPWEGEVLVRASRLFAGSEFSAECSIKIGKSNDWVTLQSGDWTIHLAIVCDARYPDLSRVIPEAGTEVATLQLNDADARFFVDAADRLPANKEAYSPLTVDLNGHVTLCARDSTTDRATALVLSNSGRTGESIAFHANRRYLQRAARMGMRSVCFPGPDGVAWCRDATRTYVWMSLAKELAIKPEQCVDRIVSPIAISAAEQAPTTLKSVGARIKSAAMVAPQETKLSTCRDQPGESSIAGDSNGEPASVASNPPSESSRGAALVAQVDSLRVVLSQALGQVRELASALRRRQRQSRLVETTLASLRQLKEVEV